jgi:hypothetical protein
VITLERLKRLSAFALLFCLVVACKQLDAPGGSTTLKSPDGKFQLTVPGGWKTLGPLKEGEIFKVGTDGGRMAVVVYFQSKADLVDDITLDKYTDDGRKNLLADGKTIDATNPESLTINGNAARRYEVKRTQDDSKVTCLFTVVETAEKFHRVVACAPPTYFETNKAALREVSESFRPVEASGSKSDSANKN